MTIFDLERVLIQVIASLIGVIALFVYSNWNGIMKIKTSIDQLTPEQKKKIEEDPLYFVMEGGSDGTLGNCEFWDEYSDWMPGASNYAAKLCEERGIEW